MFHRAVLLSCVIALGGCSGNDKKTEEAKTPAKEPAETAPPAPVDVIKAMIAAAQKGDDKAFVSHFSAKVQPPLAQLKSDPKELKVFMGGIAKSKDVTGETPKAGATQATVKFKYWEGSDWDDVSITFVLEDGAWKLFGDQDR